MTFAQLVQNINRSPSRRKFTDFIFEDGFYLCDPKAVTKATARRRYEATKGHKAPKIKVTYFVEK